MAEFGQIVPEWPPITQFLTQLGVFGSFWKLQPLIINGLEDGSAGRGQNRTSWDITTVLGIPFSRWGARPYIIHPLPFPHETFSILPPDLCEHGDSKKARIHPFRLALLWRQQIKSNPRLTQAKIAAREGLSRARVTQVMNLLHLPAQIQEELQSPPVPLEIHSFSERRLRMLLACDEGESRLLRWRELVQELQEPTRQ